MSGDSGSRLKVNRIKTAQYYTSMAAWKLESWLDSGKKLSLKPNCELKENTIFMTCAKCQVSKQRTFVHFQPHRVVKFATCEPGHESMRGVCRACDAKSETDKRDAPETFVVQLLSNYSAYGLTKEWFEEIWDKQKGRGLITNCKMERRT